jgi:hypothetical protein
MTMGPDDFYIGGNVTLDSVFDAAFSGKQRVSGSSTTGSLLYPFSSNSGIGYFGPNFIFTKDLDGVVPEPSSLAVFGIGAMGLLTTRRRRPRLA